MNHRFVVFIKNLLLNHIFAAPIFMDKKCGECNKMFKFAVFVSDTSFDIIPNCATHIKTRTAIDNNGVIWCKRYIVNFRAIVFHSALFGSLSVFSILIVRAYLIIKF